jgi:hypothetical protein
MVYNCDYYCMLYVYINTTYLISSDETYMWLVRRLRFEAEMARIRQSVRVLKEACMCHRYKI